VEEREKEMRGREAAVLRRTQELQVCELTQMLKYRSLQQCHCITDFAAISDVIITPLVAWNIVKIGKGAGAL
jgi:hypothetical protein